jgi:hypothetical protein
LIAVLSVLVIITLSLLVTRVATVALTLTGLSREAARFQARSALTTTGFTTSESERIVGHPVRRRIIMTLMLTGSAGIVTVIASLALSFATTGGARDTGLRLGLLLAGLLVLYMAARSQRFDRVLQPMIRRMLRRFTDIDVRDYASLLHIHGDFAVSELAVEEGDWLAGRLLQEVRPADEGLLILGVQRGALQYLGAPTGATRIEAGDTLIVYGPTHRLAELDRRGGGDDGDRAHHEATREATMERVRGVEGREMLAPRDGPGFEGLEGLEGLEDLEGLGGRGQAETAEMESGPRDRGGRA